MAELQWDHLNAAALDEAADHFGLASPDAADAAAKGAILAASNLQPLDCLPHLLLPPALAQHLRVNLQQ